MSRYLIIMVLAMFVAIPRICAQSQVSTDKAKPVVSFETETPQNPNILASKSLGIVKLPFALLFALLLDREL